MYLCGSLSKACNISVCDVKDGLVFFEGYLEFKDEK
jgi:hypothetical protein